MSRCPDYEHQHPMLVLSLRTRTKLWGMFNVAVALRGKSCGWGSCEHPRRTFVGRLRRPKPDRGLHFIEVATWRNSPYSERVWLRWGDRRPSLHPTEQESEAGTP